MKQYGMLAYTASYSALLSWDTGLFFVYGAYQAGMDGTAYACEQA